MNHFMNEVLTSHSMVELRNGERRILAKVSSGTKVLINPKTQSWNYLSHWDADGKVRFGINLADGEASMQAKYHDIIKVYGRITGTANYGMALTASDENRPLLWERKEAVKMTVAEICAKLGYDVEIVAET